ncbi:hypothetical protein HGM15179_011858 [Zosterops borbonicus]|uniref:Uncharacterized protein n=1 Tax=Zosterops borbonicus TaxID=364589 RepID=A0A8K1GAW1_9PASS|nr:hypothetical protein HGM15179_011858 [Zosterops borbonicus]
MVRQPRGDARDGEENRNGDTIVILEKQYGILGSPIKGWTGGIFVMVSSMTVTWCPVRESWISANRLETSPKGESSSANFQMKILDNDHGLEDEVATFSNPTGQTRSPSIVLPLERNPIRSPQADETSQAHQEEPEGKDVKVKMVKMRLLNSEQTTWPALEAHRDQCKWKIPAEEKTGYAGSLY